MVTDHTGRHPEPESLGDFRAIMADITRREVSKRPGSRALVFAEDGALLAVFDGDDDDEA